MRDAGESDLPLEQWLRALGARDRAVAFPATPDCPPLPRFRRAALREKWSAADRAHVRRCPACRRVAGEVRRELWHPTAAQLFEHAQRFLSSADAQEVTDHLEADGCRRCLRLAALLRADGILRRLAARIRLGAAGAAGDLNDALESCTAPTGVLRAGRQAGAVPAWSRFEDGRTRGRLVADARGAWLELARAGEAHDAPAHVLIGDDRGQPFWRGFLLLCRRAESRSRRARGRLPGPPPGKSAVRVLEVGVGQLTADEGEQLYEAFRAAERDDPDAVPAWRGWVGKALGQVDREGGVRGWLEKIVPPVRPADPHPDGGRFATRDRPSLSLRLPGPLYDPAALAAHSEPPLHVSAASADDRLQADLVEDGPHLLLEVRTKDPALNLALVRVTAAVEDDRAAGRTVVLLRPDVNDWYAGHAAFRTADLRGWLEGRLAELTVTVLDVDRMDRRDARAVLHRVGQDRDDLAARSAWAAWVEHVGRDRPVPTASLRELLDGVRALLTG